MHEHYGIDVTTGRVRRQSLQHGAKLSALRLPQTKEKAATVVTQLDGSMIPIIQNHDKPDRRKGKQLLWQEIRLCLTRPAQSATPLYGATLGSASMAGTLWRQTAEVIDLNAQTRVRGVGNGAE